MIYSKIVATTFSVKVDGENLRRKREREKERDGAKNL